MMSGEVIPCSGVAVRNSDHVSRMRRGCSEPVGWGRGIHLHIPTQQYSRYAQAPSPPVYAIGGGGLIVIEAKSWGGGC